ncbi:histidine kinase [Ruania zhangjianzhongii]|uniref:histidine kinase n=1 Tax=Ruania zhangjianzhongii TaxID=2603206 RepID=UPI0011C929D6|nr:histidine kinase [Ruania zhangjianzhongii]
MLPRGWWWPVGLAACAVAVPFLTANAGVVAVPGMAVLAYFAGRRLSGMQPALVAIGVGLIAQLVIAWIQTPGSFLSEWFSFAGVDFVFLILPWWIGRSVKLRNERRAEINRVIADLARSRERARIAEDMHDLLGHDLALIALSSGALELMPDSSAEQRAAATEIRRRAVAATDRLHDVVGILRADGREPSTAPAADGLTALIADARSSGLDVTVLHSGPALAAPVAQAVERVVQEALTNAAKHAPGAPIDVVIDSTHDPIVATVTNPTPPGHGDPPPSGDRPGSAGLGLIGAQERLRLLGGTLEAGEHRDGFRVLARLPARPEPLTNHGPQDPEADRSIRTVRRSIRSRQWRTAVVPLIVAVALAGTLVVFQVLTVRSTGMTRQTFDQISIGQTRAEIAALLPPSAIDSDGVPDVIPIPPTPDPETCEFYLAREHVFDLSSDLYRICADDGVIVAADHLVPGGAR